MSPRAEPVRTASTRSKLDWAILAGVALLGALNLYALADHAGAGTAQAATLVRACGVSPA